MTLQSIINQIILYCSEHENYKIGILRSCFNYIQDTYNLINFSLVNCDPNNSIVTNTFLTKQQGSIQFKNGSSIQILSTRENIRGQKFHFIIVDGKDISQTQKDYIIKPTLISDSQEHPVTYVEI